MGGYVPQRDGFTGDVLTPADIGTTVQPYSTSLDAFVAAGTGIVVRTSPSGVVGRSVVGTANRVDVVNGDGISGDIVVSSPQDTDDTATPTFGGITTAGGIFRAVTLIGSGAYLLLDTDYILICSASAGDVDITLPAASAGPRVVRIKLDDATAGGVTITPDGSDTIDGSALFVMSTIFASLDLQSDGVGAWHIFGLVTAAGIKTITQRSDLPPSVLGGIPIDRPYFVDGFIELAGEWLDWLPGGSLQGMNPQVDGFLSTGLVGGAFIRSTATFTARRIAIIGMTVALDLDGVSNPLNAISCREVFFVNCGDIGTIDSYSGMLWKDFQAINSGGLVLDGTFGGVVFQIAAFNPVPDGVTAVSVLATATIERRFEISDVAMLLAGAGSAGVDVALGVTMPAETYVVRDCLITGGGGTPIVGKEHDDIASMFADNKGFDNSTTKGSLSFEGNDTATVIAVAGVPVKVAGTTTPKADNERFTHTDGRLTHIGGVPKTFLVLCNITLEGGNNDNVAAQIGSNGTVIGTPTRVPLGTGGAGSPIVVHVTVLLGTGEYVEPFVINEGGTTNITATELVFSAVPA